MNIIFVAESEPGVESPSLSPGRYRQPVYDRLDILPNNVPDSDVSMYNTCTLCTQSNCTTNVHDRLDILPNNVHDSDASMYNTCTLCTQCSCRTNVYDRLDILPNNVPDLDVCTIHVHYVHSVTVEQMYMID